MKKLLVLVTSFLLMFGCMMLVSGCGGDKFAGEWVGVGPDTFRGGKLIHRIKIDKNGSNGKSYMVAWANLDLDSSKPENNAVQLQWRQGNTYRFGGNLNGNTLTVYNGLMDLDHP